MTVLVAGCQQEQRVCRNLFLYAFRSDFAGCDASQALQHPVRDRRLGRFATVVLTEDINMSS
jgi:hypothetical protein